MVVGKFVSKLVQSLPSWEVTKYYGRVCWFQLQCLKYRIQTSETWFNFKSKFMPDRLRNEAEHEDKSIKKKEGSGVASALIPKSTVLKRKIEKLRKMKKKAKEEDSANNDLDQSGVQIHAESAKGSKDKNVRSKPKK